MPRFDGACIAYQYIVHPCLSFNLQDVINGFSIPKEKSYNEDSFLASAEIYLKENGPEALEMLIASKVPPSIPCYNIEIKLKLRLSKCLRASLQMTYCAG